MNYKTSFIVHRKKFKCLRCFMIYLNLYKLWLYERSDCHKKETSLLNRNSLMWERLNSYIFRILDLLCRLIITLLGKQNSREPENNIFFICHLIVNAKVVQKHFRVNLTCSLVKNYFVIYYEMASQIPEFVCIRPSMLCG